MEVKAHVVLEIERSGRRYQFMMPVGAPFGEARDVAIDVLNKVWAMMAEADKKLQENIEESKKEE